MGVTAPQGHGWGGSGEPRRPLTETPAAGAPRRDMEPPPERPRDNPSVADTAAEFLSLIGACLLQPHFVLQGWGHRARQEGAGE